MYTLIAFKPEKDDGEDVVLPARIIKEQNLSREEIHDRIKFLKKDKPIIEYKWRKEEDIPFEEFFIFTTASEMIIEYAD